jgi:hypothetical protein
MPFPSALSLEQKVERNVSVYWNYETSGLRAFLSDPKP